MATIDELHRLSQPRAELALVLAGNMTAEARAMLESRHIHVWDALKLSGLATPDLLKRYFGESLKTDKNVEEDRSDSFSLALDQLSGGSANWTEYQRLAADILEHLFSPPLEPPR